MFEPGEYIGFYAGDIRQSYLPFTNHDKEYALTVINPFSHDDRDELVVDARGSTHVMGNVHMANDNGHSVFHAGYDVRMNNAAFTEYGFMVAVKAIEANSEIFVSYGEGYWGASSHELPVAATPPDRERLRKERRDSLHVWKRLGYS